MNKQVWFDMDGTIVDFYGVDNWLNYLEKGITKPYREAAPMVNMRKLGKELNRLQKAGYTVGIVSWGSKAASPQYLEKIEAAKRNWLKRHLGAVKWDFIHILPYGSPKYLGRNGILFDDEQQNRSFWGENSYTEKEIFKILETL